jgi:hypothetical protein
MAYKRKYVVDVGCNPTIPGVTTTVGQDFDGSVLTDRYIKQLTNALRRHGMLPRYGGMYQTVVMLAEQLRVSEPLGYYINRWSNQAVIIGSTYNKFPYSSEIFQEVMKASEVRAKIRIASGSSPQWTLNDKSEFHSPGGPLYLPGWSRTIRGDLDAFRGTFRELALKHIPSYLDDMCKIADFIETRPKFVVRELRPMHAVTHARQPTMAIVK